ncbi:adenosylmethionine--8-amino-7-oxononanoate transaminase [Helicobacter himalayensis]|uniref:adenosylmethionine--8-amino-7-oxononanoate transaminase n=1 Tax=Helicobacter himalayensis TaxID=1591088 RepID=UPI003D6DB34B
MTNFRDSSICKDLRAWDLAHIWHPCTQMHDHENTFPLIPIKRAKGVYLYDFDEKSYIDCVSSWWVNLFGHCNDYISQKLSQQARNLEHCIFAGFSHEPIIRLSQRLCEKLPKGLEKCFYADNGSSAIEVALKMAYHAKVLENPQFTKSLESAQETPAFISLQNAYHGETLGALSVGDVGLYKQTYKPLLLKNIVIPMPHTLTGYQNDKVDDEVDSAGFGEDYTNSKNFGDSDTQNATNYEDSLAFLESTLAQNPHIIAFIIEPLLQCAGGMQIHTPSFVARACALCKKYDVRVIFDEIAVGFGRTGTLFALQACGVVPDFLALSKGISGGYLPLSVVVTSDEIYKLFYAPYNENKAFLHSHSYTGNALACACANAVLDIFDTQDVLENNKILSRYIWEKAQNLREFSYVKNLRQRGMVCAFEIDSKNPRKGIEVYNKALQKGLLLRPLGNTIYFMPPFVINKEQIGFVFKGIREILSEREFLES